MTAVYINYIITFNNKDAVLPTYYPHCALICSLYVNVAAFML